MKNIVPRRRGRPSRSFNVPRDVESGVWIAVLLGRIGIRRRTGETPSRKAVCRELVAQGGVISVIGGNRDALASAQFEKKPYRLGVGSTGSLRPNPEGSIFASHVISNSDTLAAAYSKADKKVRTETGVRLAWMNVARQMIGLAPKRIRP